MANIIVDAHLDLAYNVFAFGRDLLKPVEEIRRQEQLSPPPGEQVGICMVTLPAMLAGRVAVAGGSIFVAPERSAWNNEPLVYRTIEEAHTLGVRQLDYYRRWTDEDRQVYLLETAADLESVQNNWATDKPSLGIFIVMEGAAPIRNAGELPWWVERGLRGITLSWSSGNQYAGGCSAPGPITDEGHKLLGRMADYNLLLDVSHLWTEAVYEVLDCYPGPLVATHANPQAFVNTARQLSDDLMRRIAERGGVIGVTPYLPMLKAGWKVGDPKPPLMRWVEAIDYICQVTGTARCVGIGSDLDGGFGVESVPAGLDSIGDIGQIEDLLVEYGYSPDDIGAICNGNWLRVMNAVLADF
ncbi:MAG: membrane dipeptidase [Anaerolineae bacterium]|nr:membrane dipeptidase [Anaerolineae bacterium]